MEADERVTEEDLRQAARHCFACGNLNPKGLQLRFRLEDGEAVAEFTPDIHHQGYPGFTHGGVVAAVLDEAMGWAVYSRGVWAMTARMQMRFRDSVPLLEPLQVRASITRSRSRLVNARAELRHRDGRLLVEAEGSFLRVPESRQEELAKAYRRVLGKSETQT
jgi:acyl-coenzyme A thioesterase PaaI-like protein